MSATGHHATMLNSIRRLCLTLACLAPMALRAASVETAHVEVELLSESAALAPGQSTWLGLRLAHEAGWHTYWLNPGDSGLPTKLTWTSIPTGFEIGTIAWPLPKRFTSDELNSFGYDGDIVLPVKVKVPVDARVDTSAHFAVTAKWLVCHEECIPGTATLSIDLPVAQNPRPNDTSRSLIHKSLLTLREEPTHTRSPQASVRGNRIEVVVTNGRYYIGKIRDVFPTQPGIVANASPAIAMRGDDIVLVFAKSDYFTSMPRRLDLLVADDNEGVNVQHIDAQFENPTAVPHSF